MSIRERIHARAFGAMGQFSDKFYKKGAHMGKVLNAMLISGFSELAASYIESKTEQARFDMMEYAYKAIAAAATGQWRLAAGFTQAAAGAGLIVVGILLRKAVEWAERSQSARRSGPSEE